jgi:hypothetical protein
MPIEAKGREVCLFTFILEYRGGTHISQVTARSPKAALQRWAMSRRVWSAISSALRVRGRIEASAFLAENLVAVEGTTGVWCTTASVRRSFALVNVIRTES